MTAEYVTSIFEEFGTWLQTSDHAWIKVKWRSGLLMVAHIAKDQRSAVALCRTQDEAKKLLA